MLFASRKPKDFRSRLRLALWPRRSWARSLRYTLLRVRRMHATPHAVGVGCAVGVFTAFTPFLGFHLLIASLITWAMRANIIAAAAGTFAGNPFTYPLIWVSTYQLGNWVLGWKATREIIELSYGVSGPGQGFWAVVVPMLVGAIPLGLIAGAVSYFLAKKAVEAYREKKQRQAVEPRQRRQRAMGRTT